MSTCQILALMLLTIAATIPILLPQQYYDYNREEHFCNMTALNDTTCNAKKEICTLKLRPNDKCLRWDQGDAFGIFTGMLLRENSGTCKVKCMNNDTCVKCGEFLCEEGLKCVYFKGFPQKCEEPKDTIPDWLRVAEQIGDVTALMNEEKNYQFRNCCETNCVSKKDAGKRCDYRPPKFDTTAGDDFKSYDVSGDNPELPQPGPNPSVVFNCMNNGRDNRECCKRKKIPEICLVFCNGDGNVTYNSTRDCNKLIDKDRKIAKHMVACAKDHVYDPKVLSMLKLDSGITKEPSSRTHVTLSASTHLSVNGPTPSTSDFPDFDDVGSGDMLEDVDAVDVE